MATAMRAVATDGGGLVEVRSVPVPEPGAGEIRVRVRAAGLNRADLLQSRGLYPAPPGAPADLLGLEYAGEVEALGPGCLGPLKVGDRVFGLVGGGGLAERVVTHERLAVRVPVDLDWTQAAAVPEAFVTAHDALVTRGQARPGERVLIHAVTGGVGLAAAQVAHAMGCFVLGTTRSLEKLERTHDSHVDVCLLTTQGHWPRVAHQATGGHGVDVLIDLLGGSQWAHNVEAMGTLGRIVLVGQLAGSKADVDLRVLMAKRLTVVATTLRARPLEEKITATRAFAACIVPWLERGLVHPVVDSTFPLDQIAAALARMESGAGFGKIVLTLG